MKYFLIPQARAVEIADNFVPAQYFNSVGSLVNVILRNVLTIAGVVAFIGVVFAGIKVISGAGDPKKLEQNKSVFTASIIGLILIVGAFFILEIAKVITGFNFLSPTF